MLFFFKSGLLSCLVPGLRSKCSNAKALLGERAMSVEKQQNVAALVSNVALSVFLCCYLALQWKRFTLMGHSMGKWL